MSNSKGRPGSAGFKYRHGWIPVAGSGAVDKRSKSKQERTPSAPPNPAATPSNPTASPKGGDHTPAPGPRRWEGVSNKELDEYEATYKKTAQANDLAPDMRSSVTKALADIEAERKHREREPVEGTTVIEPDGFDLEPQHDYEAGTHNRPDLFPGRAVYATVDGHQYRGTISHEPSAHDGEVIVELDPGVEGPDGDYRVEAHVDDVSLAGSRNPADDPFAARMNSPEMQVQSSHPGPSGGLTEPGTRVTTDVPGYGQMGATVVDGEPVFPDNVMLELDEEGPNGDYMLEVSPKDLKPE